jgi:hypothetical protein
LPPEAASKLATNALALPNPAALFRPTNVWDAHLRFTAAQWAALGPSHLPAVPGFIQANGRIILRNPQAPRNGLAGVLGIGLPWSRANLEFGGVAFTNVAARFKGNGTFVNSQRSYKRPYKIDLDRHETAQQLAGRTTLNFHNLTADASCLSDTLAYEFFRDAGVPAPRTAFARLCLSVAGRFDRRLLGLYVLVEEPDAAWAREQFGAPGVMLLKPVTYDLFQDLGDDWRAYVGVYDPKTKTSPSDRRRLIDLAKLFSQAGDVQFAARVGEFIDLAEFARFLACQTLLSNYDGILSTGQNFLLYLDPATNRFGFIPWDLDHCWGEFPFAGTPQQRERADLWHPWIGDNRFLQRMLAVRAVHDAYRLELQRFRATLFLPHRLSRRVDELAAAVRPFVAEESTDRLNRFNQATAEPPAEVSAAGRSPAPGPGPPVFALKRFFRARATAMSEQLDGKAEGIVLRWGNAR